MQIFIQDLYSFIQDALQFIQGTCSFIQGPNSFMQGTPQLSFIGEFWNQSQHQSLFWCQLKMRTLKISTREHVSII